MPSGRTKEDLAKISKKTQFKAGKEQVEIARKAGYASGVAKREKRLMREILDELLARKAGNSDMSCKEAILVRAVKQAIDGDSKAREFVRDTIGEKPVEKVINDVQLNQALVVFDKVEDETN